MALPFSWMDGDPAVVAERMQEEIRPLLAKGEIGRASWRERV